MKAMIKLYRPYDREPSSHRYGDKFDAELDSIIGGVFNWSISPNTGPNPTAKIKDSKMEVVLHENGPDFTFIFQHASEIAGYVSMIATLISTWATVRSLRPSPSRRNSFPEPDGTIIEIGDLKIRAGRDLTPDEIIDIATLLLPHAKD